MRTFYYSDLNSIKVNNKIIKYLTKIYESKGKQELFLERKPLELDRLVETAKIESTESSNAIEGIITTSKRVSDLVKMKSTPRNRNEEEIAGYRDVLNIIHENYADIPLTTNYILQLHKILYSHNTQRNIGGELKHTQNYIEAIDKDGNETLVFKPIEPSLTKDGLDTICNEYNKVIEKGEVEPLLLIPTFIHDFLCIHPFSDGNGRISRLLTILLLYKAGFIIPKYIALESIINKNKDLYYDALNDASLGWNENKEDITSFVQYFLYALFVAYTDFENRVDMVDDKPSAEKLVLKAIYQKVIKFTKADIMNLCPTLSSSSIEKQLARLVEQGKLRKVLRGRSSFYIIDM